MVERNSLINEGFDEMNFRSDPAIRKMLTNDEQILLSTTLYKYNKSLKRQERSMLITSKSIYNINKSDFFASLMSVFNSNFQVRRKIDIQKLNGISVSELSSEFVLHIADEYDYRYSSPQKRDRILSVLCNAFYLNIKTRPLIFFFKQDINLIKVTTTQDDKKIGVNRMPTTDGSALDAETLKIRFEERNQKKEKIKAKTETVFTKVEVTQKITLDDFEMLKVLGRGAFGKVMLVEKKGTKQVFAMKALHKEDIIDKEQIEHTKTERFVLEKSNSPFLVGLEFAFQTPEKIFFVMQFMRGGELFQHLRSCKRFEEKRAKFYAAEIILALEHLHSMGVVYRDLKPENVLLDDEGHVCLTDFGMAKVLKGDQLTKSLVGTPEYLAPEIIDGKGHAKPVDWWALGTLIFEMILGAPPFYSKEQTTPQMFNAIAKNPVNFGSKVKLSAEAKDIIVQLLIKDPADRLGSHGTYDVKAHPWFSDIDWDLLAQKKMTPPFKPKISSDYDVDNFDTEFTNEDVSNSMTTTTTNMALVRKYQSEFKDFTYMPKDSMLHS